MTFDWKAFALQAGTNLLVLWLARKVVKG